METVILIVTLIGIVIALFWIALPFLVNATNNRLDKLIAEVKGLRAAVEKQNASGHV
jgi:ABC-type sulfate transport system permease component